MSRSRNQTPQPHLPPSQPSVLLIPLASLRTPSALSAFPTLPRVSTVPTTSHTPHFPSTLSPLRRRCRRRRRKRQKRHPRRKHKRTLDDPHPHLQHTEDARTHDAEAAGDAHMDVVDSTLGSCRCDVTSRGSRGRRSGEFPHDNANALAIFTVVDGMPGACTLYGR